MQAHQLHKCKVAELLSFTVTAIWQKGQLTLCHIAVFENIAWIYMLLQSMKDRNHSNVNPSNLGLLVKPMFNKTNV